MLYSGRLIQYSKASVFFEASLVFKVLPVSLGVHTLNVASFSLTLLKQTPALLRKICLGKTL